MNPGEAAGANDTRRKSLLNQSSSSVHRTKPRLTGEPALWTQRLSIQTFVLAFLLDITGELHIKKGAVKIQTKNNVAVPQLSPSINTSNARSSLQPLSYPH